MRHNSDGWRAKTKLCFCDKHAATTETVDWFNGGGQETGWVLWTDVRGVTERWRGNTARFWAMEEWSQWPDARGERVNG